MEDSLPHVLAVRMERPIISELSDHRGLPTFATWCALHLEQLLLVFAETERRPELELWLERLRGLAATEDSAVARKLRSEIEGSPEASCDDSNSPTYYAMRALSVAAYAAGSWIAPDPTESA